jgi:hypothetical protein
LYISACVIGLEKLGILLGLGTVRLYDLKMLELPWNLIIVRLVILSINDESISAFK